MPTPPQSQLDNQRAAFGMTLEELDRWIARHVDKSGATSYPNRARFAQSLLSDSQELIQQRDIANANKLINVVKYILDNLE